MSFKKNYFISRNSLLRDGRREYLAEREIKTILLLLENFYDQPDIKNLNVLDVGAGDFFLKSIIEKYGARYTGIDIEDCDFENEDFPLDDNIFDLIICYSVIEHLSDPSKMLENCRRTMKNKAFLIIETPNWRYCKLRFYDDYTHVKPYTDISLKKLLEDSGFYQIELMPNVRCKSLFFYRFKYRFLLASLLPFKGQNKYFPFLSGRATGLIACSRSKS